MTFLSMMPNVVKQKLQTKTYEPDSTILYAQEDNFYVYFLVEGIAEAYVPSPQGTLTTLALYEAGSFFGEIEQFYEGRKPVEITAITTCTLQRLHQTDFLNWLEQDFTATKFLIKELAYKLITNAELVEDVLILTVRERLLRCVALHQHKKTLHKLTKAQLVKEVNAPIRSINRAIMEYESQDIILYQNHQFTILNEAEVMKYLPMGQLT